MDLEEVDSTAGRPGPESPKEQDHDGSRSFPSQLVSLTEGDAVTDVDHGPEYAQDSEDCILRRHNWAFIKHTHWWSGSVEQSTRRPRL